MKDLTIEMDPMPLSCEFPLRALTPRSPIPCNISLGSNASPQVTNPSRVRGAAGSGWGETYKKEPSIRLNFE